MVVLVIVVVVVVEVVVPVAMVIMIVMAAGEDSAQDRMYTSLFQPTSSDCQRVPCRCV